MKKLRLIFLVLLLIGCTTNKKVNVTCENKDQVKKYGIKYQKGYDTRFNATILMEYDKEGMLIKKIEKKGQDTARVFFYYYDEEGKKVISKTKWMIGTRQEILTKYSYSDSGIKKIARMFIRDSLIDVLEYNLKDQVVSIQSKHYNDSYTIDYDKKGRVLQEKEELSSKNVFVIRKYFYSNKDFPLPERKVTTRIATGDTVTDIHYNYEYY